MKNEKKRNTTDNTFFRRRSEPWKRESYVLFAQKIRNVDSPFKQHYSRKGKFLSFCESCFVFAGRFDISLFDWRCTIDLYNDVKQYHFQLGEDLPRKRKETHRESLDCEFLCKFRFFFTDATEETEVKQRIVLRVNTLERVRVLPWWTNKRTYKSPSAKQCESSFLKNISQHNRTSRVDHQLSQTKI